MIGIAWALGDVFVQRKYAKKQWSQSIWLKLESKTCGKFENLSHMLQAKTKG
jgi:hypothetical protein